MPTNQNKVLMHSEKEHLVAASYNNSRSEFTAYTEPWLDDVLSHRLPDDIIIFLLLSIQSSNTRYCIQTQCITVSFLFFFRNKSIKALFLTFRESTIEIVRTFYSLIQLTQSLVSICIMVQLVVKNACYLFHYLWKKIYFLGPIIISHLHF